MIPAKKSIAVFDSGYGGLTILKQFRALLPEYNYVYLGDNARTPYGTRSFKVVYDYTLQAVTKLLDMNCELVILACNTASAKALRNIQQQDLPKLAPKKRVLGIIRPTAEIIGSYTSTGHIGLFGTTGTINSESYPIEINKLYPSIKVTGEACPMWVPIIENGEHNSKGADFFIKQHCKRLLKKDPQIDTIILACTHYCLFKDKIKSFLPTHIKLISQGEIIAKSLQNYLNRHPEMDKLLAKEGKCTYYTTESSEKFEQSANIFLKEEVMATQISL